MKYSQEIRKEAENCFQKGLSVNYVAQVFDIPYDNAVIASFFRTLKTEQIYVNTYKTVSELSESIDEYMHFYNEVRPHQKLHNLTPNEFEQKHYLQKV